MWKRNEFYDSADWAKARYAALRKVAGFCQCCGNRPTTSNPLHVDHIKPRSKFPELELIVSNLQVLCRLCNIGKSARDMTAWRLDETPSEDRPTNECSFCGSYNSRLVAGPNSLFLCQSCIGQAAIITQSLPE